MVETTPKLWYDSFYPDLMEPAKMKVIEKPTFKKLQLDLPPELHARFKAAVAINQTTMMAVLKPYIEQWLKENERPWQDYSEKK